MSKEFSRTENRILGALARLDDSLMNPLLPGGSGTTPEPTRNASGINQGTNEDDSQNDPHPEASLFHGQREQNSGTERDYDMVTGVNEQTRNDYDMVTGVQKERICDYDMVTGVTERHDMVRAVQQESLWDYGMVTEATETNRNRHEMVTGVHRERVYSHDIVTGATQQIGKCHDLTGVHEEVTYCPLVHLQGSRRKTVLPVNHNSAVKTLLRRLRQTKFCWPFSSWQIATILRIFTIISTEFPNCQSH